MRERRVFPRYDVSKYPEFKASTVEGPIGEKLMTLSIGGCGFWAPAEDFKFQLNQRVKISFVSEAEDSDPIELSGEVLYILPHPLESLIGRFYGIRFLTESDREKVHQAIDALEALYQQGKIQMA